MAQRPYTASLSQSQGRSGYSIIFRHPARRDDATGKVGVRVRMGLGTRDEAEANRLREQLDELLSSPRFHTAAARADAERQFDARVVDIFFYKMTPGPVDFLSLRDEVIALPKTEIDGYRHVLMLGTTGAGKTTLVRQLIGTDPKEERFPSTSTAKTTVHDTEIVLADGSWRAVVTFVPSEEAREYLTECISAAVLAASKGMDNASVTRRLLSHVNQRFRFNYVLGNGPKAPSTDFDEDEEGTEDQSDLFAGDDLAKIDLAVTDELLSRTVVRLREIGLRLSENVRKALDVSNEQDERVADELFEDELDNLLREEEAFHTIADELMDEIEKRFDLLPAGEVKRTKQGWPLSWTAKWAPSERREFLRAISRFSSNYAPYFGRLLTPLVNGVRVQGPFSPDWAFGRRPKLVLLDGEGLGHTPQSSSSISTTVSRRIETVDAVILVDSATQPMQAAPLAAMRELVATGNARKLILAFTHFDEVRGDNLPNAQAKAQHVLASAENVLASFGEELGSFAERALRKRLESARFFLGGLQEPLSADKPSGKQTISQLNKLLDAIDQTLERPAPTHITPVYDRMNLGFAVRSAAEGFHKAWWPRLGLELRPGVPKEHWGRIKALSRRFAQHMSDEYDSLKPVADLRKESIERLYVFIQNPLHWEGGEPDDDEKQAIYDAFADSLGKRLLDLAARRLSEERTEEWQNAFDKRGTGSTFVRARIIGEDIYDSAAPVPDMTPTPDRNQFLHQVIAAVEEAAIEVGARLQ